MDKNEMINFTKNAKNLAYEFIANVDKDDIIILRGGEEPHIGIASF